MKKKYPILFFSILLLLFSCKKKCDNMNVISLSETNWDLYFKNNPAFTFFAKTHLYLKQDSTFDNYEAFDSTYGKWSQNNTDIKFNFDNGARYSGSIITADSLSGTLTVAGSNGVWYALKK